ncbi:MAG: hypothetical protein WC627_04395 [Legionella sp.]|jgi:hypothetical protein
MINQKSIENLILSIYKTYIKVISTPQIYIAVIIGRFVGFVFGGVIGTILSWYYSNPLHLINNEYFIWGIDANKMLALLFGMTLGACLGAFFLGLLTLYKIYKSTRTITAVSENNIQEIRGSAVRYSLQVAVLVSVFIVLVAFYLTPVIK